MVVWLYLCLFVVWQIVLYYDLLNTVTTSWFFWPCRRNTSSLHGSVWAHTECLWFYTRMGIHNFKDSFLGRYSKCSDFESNHLMFKSRCFIVIMGKGYWSVWGKGAFRPQRIGIHSCMIAKEWLSSNHQGLYISHFPFSLFYFVIGLQSNPPPSLMILCYLHDYGKTVKIVA